jgi:hypothetical protein
MELAELKRPFLDEINQIRFVSHENKLFCHSFIVWSEKKHSAFPFQWYYVQVKHKFPHQLELAWFNTVFPLPKAR